MTRQGEVHYPVFCPIHLLLENVWVADILFKMFRILLIVLKIFKGRFLNLIEIWNDTFETKDAHLVGTENSGKVMRDCLEDAGTVWFKNDSSLYETKGKMLLFV